MSEFHFLRPLWLLALIPLSLLSWQFFRLGREGGDWRKLCDPALLPYILVHDGGGERVKRASLWFALGGWLGILALAGPVWERLPVPAFRNDAALVIALDLSHIMDAQDVKPSRLERARFKIADILKQRKDGLTALLVYSGDAFTVTPLTDDVGTINAQLSALSSDIMPAQGSRADIAISKAVDLLKQAGLTRGDVLLITNGGSLTRTDGAVKALKSQGYRLSILGVGNEEGAPVPLAGGGFLKGDKDDIIISKLATPALQRLAQQGGGIFEKVSSDNSDIASLLSFFEQQLEQGKDGEGKAGASVEQWEERGPWLLLLLLPIAALAFRRGVLVVLLLAALPLPKPAQALEWKDLWQTREQQAYEAFQKGDFAKAEAGFENPQWKAAAQYKQNKFDETVETLDGQNAAEAYYNQGNAYAKADDLYGAVVAYDKALKLNPNHEDAKYNKALVEKKLEEQQKQNQQQNQQQNKKQQGNKDGQGEDKPKQGQGQQQQDPNQTQQDQNQQTGKPQQDQQQQNQAENQQGDQSKEQSEQAQQPSEQGKQSQQGKQAQDKQAEKEAELSRGQAQKADKPADKDGQQGTAMDAHKSEEQQADKQMLERIVDDPGGLLKRKFYYQYQQRQGGQ